MNTASLATIPVGFEVGTGAHVDVPYTISWSLGRPRSPARPLNVSIPSS